MKTNTVDTVMARVFPEDSKYNWKKVKDILEWVILIICIAAFLFTSISVVNAKKNDENFYMFGYRPVLILTGSMEPYMMTNSVVLTKRVTDMSQLEEGDVITYHVQNSAGRTLRITHRIIDIEDNLIYTKGDNNNVSDGYALTINNVETKVVAVCNATAEIAAIWHRSTTGKIFIICSALCIYGLIRAAELYKEGKDEKKKEEKTKEAEKIEQ